MILNKLIIIFGIALSVLVFLFVNSFTRGLANSNDYIKIPVSEIDQNIKFYEFNNNGVKINFFVVKAKDGSIKTAFDACDVCYESKKGYRQEGDYIVCNNCGSRFRIEDLGIQNKNPGGCWPGYLANKVEGDFVLIKKSDLIKGDWRFK